MKRFLFDILLFIVMALGLASVGDYLVSYGLRRTTIRPFAAWNDIYNHHNLDNDLVLLGASSCWAHYNPQILDSVLHISTYNLGIDGHPWYPCQPLRYYTYVRHTNKPRYVIICIDIGTFKYDKKHLYDREQFFPFFYLDDSLVSAIQEYKNITFLERYCPMYRYYGYRQWIEVGVASCFGKSHFGDDGLYKGYRGNDYSWNPNRDTEPFSLSYDNAMVDSLLQFIEKRKSDNQKVVLLKSPIYYKLQQRFTNREAICQFHDSIAHVAGVDLLNYWDYPIIYDSTYFYNNGHLNKRGAETISLQLAHDLQQLGIGVEDVVENNNSQ